SGIWPPSKPCTWLPVRALAPLTPRPLVLPRPDEEPRPSLSLRLWAPGLLAIWLSFIITSPWPGRPKAATRPPILLVIFDDLDEVPHGMDHAAHRRGVFQGASAADFAETQAAQGGGLNVRLAIGAANLAHSHRFPGHRLTGLCFLLGHGSSLS